MNKHVNYMVEVDEDTQEIVVDVGVIVDTTDELLELFGVSIAYLLTDYKDWGGELNQDEVIEKILSVAIETRKTLEERDNRPDINYNPDELDNAINKMLEGFEK